MSDKDRPHAGRVQVEADVEVEGPKRRVHAKLREIAKDSAKLVVAELPAVTGEMADLFLPGPGGTIEVLTEVLSTAGAPPTLDLVLHFSMVDPSKRRALDQLLELLLAGSGGGSRQ